MIEHSTLVDLFKSFKYLGLFLNPKLKYEEHYESVCKNMTKRIHMLKRQRKFFTPKWRHIFTTSLVISSLEYCLPIWGNTLSDGKMTRINNILLKAAKYIVVDRNT